MEKRTLTIDQAYPRMLQYSRGLSWFAFYITDVDHFFVALGRRRHVAPTNAQGAFEHIAAFWADAKYPLAGYLGYDLKNDLEPLESNHRDAFDMAPACLFEPLVWVEVNGNRAILTGEPVEMRRLVDFLEGARSFEPTPSAYVKMTCGTDKPTYLSSARTLLDHIRRGDIYEVNYCVQFLGEAGDFDPWSRFFDLRNRTRAPFSVFANFGGKYVMGASPERFLRHRSGELISQPIKGTARRSVDPDEDRRLAKGLRDDQKERSENVMIVDLVRNDLSRVAVRGSVCVPELFGIQSFKTVHHMVSTVGARLAQDRQPLDAVRACFPPGSMTGAPKISAMNLIEDHEDFKRGCYAGGFGLFYPNGDFDLNVVIRTLIYNGQTHTVGFSVGSALTALADPEREYEECMLKAQALLNVLHGTTSPEPH